MENPHPKSFINKRKRFNDYKVLGRKKRYEKEIDTVQTPIDNYIGNKNKGKILAPFPHLVWQIIGLPSNISSGDQKVTLNEAFRNSHRVLSDFVKSKGISIMNGGMKHRKKKGKTLSFLQSAMKKFRRVMKKSLSRKVSRKH